MINDATRPALSNPAVVASATDASRVKALCAVDIEVAEDFGAISGDRLVIAIGDPSLQQFRDRRLVHVIRASASDSAIDAVIRAVASGKAIQEPTALEAPTNAEEAHTISVLVDAWRRLARTPDPIDIESTAKDLVIDLVQADRAYCLFYRRSDGALWSENLLNTVEGDKRSSIAGMAGWAALTGMPVIANCVSGEARWLPEIDDPIGASDDRMIVQPVVGRDAQSHAVLIAVRRRKRSAFDANEAKLMSQLASLLATVLEYTSLDLKGQELLDAMGQDQLFGGKTPDMHEAPQWGAVVQPSPAWIGRAYLAIVALFTSAILLSALIRVDKTSAGSGIVRATDYQPETISVDGVITTLLTAEGRHVEKGDALALVWESPTHRPEQGDNVAPSSDGLKLAGASSVPITAHVSGTITSLLAGTGSRVHEGDVLAVIAPDAKLEVLALFPAADRNRLRVGMPVELTPADSSSSPLLVNIDRIDAEVVSPQQVDELIRGRAARTTNSPAVIVHAVLPPSCRFPDSSVRVSAGQIVGSEVRIGTQPLLFFLVPKLRKLL